MGDRRTLRHTGVRLEELTELTHLALISHRLPDTGEIVPMLHVVPSKTNEERLLLVGPELATVMATIITRLHTQNGGTIPLTRHYDGYERTTGPALPHLFQRRRGTWRWSVIGPTTVRKLLVRALETGAICATRPTSRCTTPPTTSEECSPPTPSPEACPCTSSPEAVFNDDLVRTYRAFLDKRRAQRPEAEYREPTDQEWRDFQQHFQERKLELGQCGRPYGTSCEHEHTASDAPACGSTPPPGHAWSTSPPTSDTASKKPG